MALRPLSHQREGQPVEHQGESDHPESVQVLPQHDNPAVLHSCDELQDSEVLQGDDPLDTGSRMHLFLLVVLKASERRLRLALSDSDNPLD